MALFTHPSYLRAKLRRKAFCRLGVGAVLHRDGVILNNQPSDSAISLGNHTHIRGELFTFGQGGKISLGNYCYVGEGTKIWSAVSVEIGDHVLIAHGCSIMDCLTHPIDPMQRRQHYRDIILAGHPSQIDLGEKPVKIEEDAWIAAHSIIQRGVTIGARSIVSAGSIVREDVPPDAIVAGNPARIVRMLNEHDR
ncbi:MAG: acyltransferase [Sphingopyxis sp.]|nr:acyltransferase [Sphingopyxis sp.]